MKQRSWPTPDVDLLLQSCLVHYTLSTLPANRGAFPYFLDLMLYFNCMEPLLLQKLKTEMKNELCRLFASIFRCMRSDSNYGKQ